MFINNLFNTALDITYRQLRHECGPVSAHFDGHSNSSLYVIHNHYTNEKAVLRRQFGTPGSHRHVFGEIRSNIWKRF